MSPLLLRCLLVVPWAAALYGTLQIHSLDLNLGHSLCGPWGCGPPTEALIGYHGFWVVIILPAVALMGSLMGRQPSKWLGLVLLLGGIAGTAGFVIVDGMQFANHAGSLDHTLQRALFIVATSVDVPMLQMTGAGGLLLAVYGRSHLAASAPTFSSDATAPDGAGLSSGSL